MQCESMTVVVMDMFKTLDGFSLSLLQAQILSTIEVEVMINEAKELI